MGKIGNFVPGYSSVLGRSFQRFFWLHRFKVKKSPIALEERLCKTVSCLGKSHSSQALLTLHKGKGDPWKEKTGGAETTSYGFHTARIFQIDGDGLD
jgi:hypothetical protein